MKYKRHKLMGFCITLDGERITNWYLTASEALNELNEQLADLQN